MSPTPYSPLATLPSTKVNENLVLWTFLKKWLCVQQALSVPSRQKPRGLLPLDTAVLGYDTPGWGAQPGIKASLLSGKILCS